MANKENLLLLFERPQEPVFMTKGQKQVFDVPDNFLVDRYRPIGNVVQNRFNAEAEQRIPVRDISIPDLSIPMQIGRQEQFSLFLPKHRKVAAKLIDLFLDAKSIDDLQSIAVYARDRLNPYLFNYALSVALLHRSDTKNLNIPTLFQVFPDKYLDSAIFGRLREEATIVSEGSRMPIIIPKDYTASDLEPEHRLWYFREDIGVNLGHWHWHLVYPFESARREIVAKDRRGELFYYLHQQIIARYNFERFCNDLPKVKRFNNLREPIVEGYFPKLDSLVASRAWPPRVENSKLQDVNRQNEQIKIDISDLERWRDRIYEAIQQKFVVDERGNRISLVEDGGIDILGNVIESSILSPNRQLYGDLHNMGHVIMSYIHDPDHRYLEQLAIMGDPATDMRDPIFFRWHAYIDDIFQEYIKTLSQYTEPQLNFQGVTITDVQVDSQGGRPNILNTFWQQSDVNLTRGLDFVPRGDVFVRMTHLQHNPFTYSININNSGSAQRLGTVRIFLAPKTDERGTEMIFNEQRLLMIELDKFVVLLRPGQNTIRRRSDESSVTIPFERNFRDLDANRPAPGTPEEQGFIFCGCGWPQHLLIPKGTENGYRCELFVMVSNYEDDKVDQDLVGSCNDAVSYCGVRDRLYPDRKPMGYPFNRLSRPGADRLKTFITPNMFVKDVTIVHTNTTTVRQQQK